MNLYRLSRLGIALCLTGLALLLVLGVVGGNRIGERQQEISALQELQKRINEFSVASDNLVLFGADDDLWSVYQSESLEIRRMLEQLGERHGDAHRAARRVEQLAQSVGAVLAVTRTNEDPARPDPGIAPLEVPVRSRIIMNQVAVHGIALDSALDSAMRERRQAITGEATRIGIALAGAALLFGVLCTAAFILIHRRIARPARALVGTLEQIRAGDSAARARITGIDELSHLAATLNRTLDERDAADLQLARQQEQLRATLAELEETRDRLLRAQSIANLGSWEVDLEKDRLEWSDQVYKIFGLADDEFEGTEAAFFERVHPNDRDWLRDRYAEWLNQGGEFHADHRIIGPNGGIRWVREQARITRYMDGKPAFTTGTIQDITEQRRTADRLATMLESITDGFVAFDNDWRYTYVNSEAARLLGRSAEALIGKTVWSQFPELSETLSGRALNEAMHEHMTSAAEEYFEPLGAWFEMRAYPWEQGVAAIFRDVTENHRILEQVRAQEAALRISRDKLDAALTARKALINSLPAHIAMLDSDGVILDVNDQWRHYGQLNGHQGSDFGVGTNYVTLCETASGDCAEEAQVVAGGLRDVLKGRTETFALEYPCHSPDRQQWFRVMFNRLTTGQSETQGAVAMHIDITERKLAENELNRLAYEDSLTGLLSRNGFVQRMRERFASNGWPAGGVAMLDVIRQHDINEAHGYTVGDRVLVELGQRLQRQAGKLGLVARIGGDEFVVYLPTTPGIAFEEQLAGLMQAIDQPVPLDTGGTDIDVGLRMGYTVLGDQPRDPVDLLHEAELALFESHDSTDKRRPWIAFSPELNRQTRERIQLTGELRRALEADEFELHFQPKVNLVDGSLISAEALLRWHHPERGLLPPGVFIPVAEQSQMIGPIGDWVLRAACRQLSEWQRDKLATVGLAVNVSQVQFMLGGFPARVKAALEEFNVDPARLSLEITESVFERHSEHLLAEIRQLSELGVRLSLDDFGTGYSSLLYLQRYPFDEIKIDRGFVSCLLDDGFSRDIVRTVMSLASALGAETVAEGIESREIVAALLELGCTVGQGYYYSIPLEAEDFRWLLARGGNLPLLSNETLG